MDSSSRQLSTFERQSLRDAEELLGHVAKVRTGFTIPIKFQVRREEEDLVGTVWVGLFKMESGPGYCRSLDAIKEATEEAFKAINRMTYLDAIQSIGIPHDMAPYQEPNYSADLYNLLEERCNELEKQVPDVRFHSMGNRVVIIIGHLAVIGDPADTYEGREKLAAKAAYEKLVFDCAMADVFCLRK